MSKKIAYIFLICCLLCGCSRFNLRASSYYDTQNPIVTMTLANKQRILIELYPDIAPNTVNNFISLIKDGYYDGIKFHRIIPDYIVQGGDPIGNNYGCPGYTIKGEFKNNGFKNKLKHGRGVVSMARGSKYDSAGSQFFITIQDADDLNGSYAAFGKVIDGMEVVDNMNSLSQDLPIIEKVTVDTKMRQYPEPIVIPINSKKNL